MKQLDHGPSPANLAVIDEVFRAFGTDTMAEMTIPFSLTSTKTFFMKQCEETSRVLSGLPPLHELLQCTHSALRPSVTLERLNLKSLLSEQSTGGLSMAEQKPGNSGAVWQRFCEFREHCLQSSNARPYFSFWMDTHFFKQLHARTFGVDAAPRGSSDASTPATNDTAPVGTDVVPSVLNVNAVAEGVLRRYITHSDRPLGLSTDLVTRISQELVDSTAPGNVVCEPVGGLLS